MISRATGVFICTWVIFILCCGFFPFPVLAFEEVELYGAAESFTWREFVAGEQVLRESGPLFGVGVDYRFFDPNSLAVKVRGELFGGQVDYVGQACDLSNNCEPTKSNTNYFGIKAQGDIGKNFRINQGASLEPFAGLGFMWWLRDIKDSITAGGNFAQGGEENWRTIYFRLGIRGDYDFSRQTRGFAEVGARLPVYTENAPNDLDITLEPKDEPSLFAEAGIKFDSLKVSAFYEGLRFRESDAKFTGFYDPGTGLPIYAFQPESKADIYGIRIGYVF